MISDDNLNPRPTGLSTAPTDEAARPLHVRLHALHRELSYQMVMLSEQLARSEADAKEGMDSLKYALGRSKMETQAEKRRANEYLKDAQDQQERLALNEKTLKQQAENHEAELMRSMRETEGEKLRAERYLKHAKEKQTLAKELHGALNQEKERCEHYKKEARQLQRERDALRKELAQLRCQFEVAMEERAKKEALLETRRLELKAAQSHFSSADACSKQDVVRLVFSAAQRKIDAVTTELEEARRKDGKWMKEREEMYALLEQRRIELQVAHTYFDSVDTVTEKDVVRALGILNAEIFQAVLSIAESFTTVEKNASNGQIAGTALGIVGQNVFNGLLSFPNPQLNPILLEVALQVTIVRVTGWIIDTWDMEHWGSSLIASTYDRMVSSENQRVAARWRMLAHKYQQPRPATGRHWEDELTEKLQFCLSAVIVVARGEYVPEKEEENIRIIVRAALRLRKMIREDISSSDYQITVGVSGEPFDPESMIDHYATKGSVPQVGARLLCPYELGLRRVDRREEDGTMAVRPVTLVKSKVLLESAINELLWNPKINGCHVN